MSLAAMKQALEALELAKHSGTLEWTTPTLQETITALRAAIEAAEKAEPVAEMTRGWAYPLDGNFHELPDGTLLYTHPQGETK